MELVEQPGTCCTRGCAQDEMVADGLERGATVNGLVRGRPT